MVQKKSMIIKKERKKNRFHGIGVRTPLSSYLINANFASLELFYK